ncbi:MAG: patatin family protein [Crocinitomicaceae bacterium]
MKEVKTYKRTLVVQGGGFRTSFTAGVLDAFIMSNYRDFDFFVGNSGGAIALSYFLSNQYKKYYEAMCLLASDPDFFSYNRIMAPEGMMNVDFFKDVANRYVPFEMDKAIEFIEDKELAFVMTDLTTGKPHYYRPNKKTWIDAIIASCTLPFVTKGKHSLNNREYMDGGWSDPLPVEWAYSMGARDILVIRTLQPDLKLKQSWSDYFGSMVYRTDDPIKDCFVKSHEVYNRSVDFINNPPDDLAIKYIAPIFPLKTGTYSNSVDAVTADYRNGLDRGIEFIRNGN